jgi:hypothetical protein
MPTSFASALRALAKRVAISMSRFAGHGNSSLPIYVVTHRGIQNYKLKKLAAAAVQKK